MRNCIKIRQITNKYLHIKTVHNQGHNHPFHRHVCITCPGCFKHKTSVLYVAPVQKLSPNF